MQISRCRARRNHFEAIQYEDSTAEDRRRSGESAWGISAILGQRPAQARTALPDSSRLSELSVREIRRSRWGSDACQLQISRERYLQLHMEPI